MLDVKKEFNIRYGNFVVVMHSCGNYIERMPKVTIDDDIITILGSEYQIFNMKRSDSCAYWEHFYKVLGIDINGSLE